MGIHVLGKDSVENLKTGILFFSRTAEEEALTKDFISFRRPSSNIAIARKLISQTKNIIKKTGLPYLVIDSNVQTGNTFGERFTSAIEQVFSVGFENVICIGNDCPALSTRDIIQAANQLLSNDYVLGPSNDGGFYLIGLGGNVFEKDRLKDLPWESEELAFSFFQYLAEQKSSYYLTPVKHDVDTNNDIQIILKNSHISLALQRIIRSILASLFNTRLAFNVQIISSNSHNTFSLRGPPAVY